jgi:hypothetical protein
LNTERALTKSPAEAGNMADSDVTRKLQAYRALYRVNRAFAHITRNLDELLVAGFFKDDIPDESNPHGWQDQMNQMQSTINRRLTENLHAMEHGDIMRLARVQAIDEKVLDLYFPKRKKRRR